jgi:translocation and assembly module TamB
MINKALKLIILLIIFASMILSTLFYTRPGMQMVYLFSQLTLPGELGIAQLKGPNLTRLQLRDLDYHSADQNIHIHRLQLAWNPLYLLLGKLRINTLRIQQVTVTEKQHTDSQFSWTKLREIQVRNAKLRDLNWIDLAGHKHHLSSIHLDTDNASKHQQLHKLSIIGNHFKLSGSGKIAPRLKTPLDFSLTLNTQHYHRQLSGHAHLFGTWKKLTLEATLNPPFAAEVNGSIDLHTHAPSVDLHANWHQLSWPLNAQTQLIWPQGSLSITGPIEHYQLKLNTRIGTTQTPMVQIKAQGSGNLQHLWLPKLSLKTLSGIIQGTFKLSFEPLAWALQLHGKQLNPGQYWRGYQGIVNFDVSSEGNNQTQTHTLHRLSGQLHQHRLGGHGAITLSPQQRHIDHLDVNLGKQRLFVNGNLYPNSDLSWNIHIPDVSAIDKQAHGSIVSAGRLNTKQFASQTHIDQLVIANHRLNLLHLNTRGNRAQHQLNLKLNHPNYKAQVELYGSCKADSWQAHIAKGHVVVQDDGMAIISDITASAELNLKTSALSTPERFIGSLKLHDTTISLPLLGVRLSGVQLQANSTADKSLRYHGHLNSAKGSLDLSGQAQVNQHQLLNHTHLNGKNFQLINTDEYKITINPNLDIDTVGYAVQTSGKIDIPKAKIAPQDLSQTVEMPLEVVYVDQATLQTLPFAFTSDVNLTVGPQVELDILGIRGNVTGKIHVQDNPLTQMLANGELAIANGRYEAYGRHLAIKRGNLSFSGGRIDNPGLNVSAEREVVNQSESALIPAFAEQHFHDQRLGSSTFSQQANRFTVGLNITGTLEKPVIKLFSKPITLPDAEILSYLILNHPTSAIGNDPTGTANRRTLLNALPALGLSSNAATKITHELQHALGLDQMEITGTTDPLSNNLAQTSISIGKAISRRLYVSYSYGLLNAKNALRIRYLLNPSWTLQSEAITDAESSATSIDVIYSIEK